MGCCQGSEVKPQNGNAENQQQQQQPPNQTQPLSTDALRQHNGGLDTSAPPPPQASGSGGTMIMHRSGTTAVPEPENTGSDRKPSRGISPGSPFSSGRSPRTGMRSPGAGRLSISAGSGFENRLPDPEEEGTMFSDGNRRQEDFDFFEPNKDSPTTTGIMNSNSKPVSIDQLVPLAQKLRSLVLQLRAPQQYAQMAASQSLSQSATEITMGGSTLGASSLSAHGSSKTGEEGEVGSPCLFGRKISDRHNNTNAAGAASSSSGNDALTNMLLDDAIGLDAPMMRSQQVDEAAFMGSSGLSANSASLRSPLLSLRPTERGKLSARDLQELADLRYQLEIFVPPPASPLTPSATNAHEKIDHRIRMLGIQSSRSSSTAGSSSASSGGNNAGGVADYLIVGGGRAAASSRQQQQQQQQRKSPFDGVEPNSPAAATRDGNNSGPHPHFNGLDDIEFLTGSSSKNSTTTTSGTNNSSSSGHRASSYSGGGGSGRQPRSPQSPSTPQSPLQAAINSERALKFEKERAMKRLAKTTWADVRPTARFLSAVMTEYTRRGKEMADAFFPVDDLREKCRRFITFMDSAMQQLDTPPRDFRDFMGRLGHRHFTYGIQRNHFLVMKDIFMHALRSCLGMLLSDEVEQACEFTFGLLVDEMVGVIRMLHRAADSADYFSVRNFNLRVRQWLQIMGRLTHDGDEKALLPRDPLPPVLHPSSPTSPAVAAAEGNEPIVLAAAPPVAGGQRRTSGSAADGGGGGGGGESSDSLKNKKKQQLQLCGDNDDDDDLEYTVQPFFLPRSNLQLLPREDEYGQSTAAIMSTSSASAAAAAAGSKATDMSCDSVASLGRSWVDGKTVPQQRALLSRRRRAARHALLTHAAVDVCEHVLDEAIPVLARVSDYISLEDIELQWVQDEILEEERGTQSRGSRTSSSSDVSARKSSSLGAGSAAEAMMTDPMMSGSSDLEVVTAKRVSRRSGSPKNAVDERSSSGGSNPHSLASPATAQSRLANHGTASSLSSSRLLPQHQQPASDPFSSSGGTRTSSGGNPDLRDGGPPQRVYKGPQAPLLLARAIPSLRYRAAVALGHLIFLSPRHALSSGSAQNSNVAAGKNGGILFMTEAVGVLAPEILLFLRRAAESHLTEDEFSANLTQALREKVTMKHLVSPNIKALLAQGSSVQSQQQLSKTVVAWYVSNLQRDLRRSLRSLGERHSSAPISGPMGFLEIRLEQLPRLLQCNAGGVMSAIDRIFGMARKLLPIYGCVEALLLLHSGEQSVVRSKDCKWSEQAKTCSTFSQTANSQRQAVFDKRHHSSNPSAAQRRPGGIDTNQLLDASRVDFSSNSCSPVMRVAAPFASSLVHFAVHLLVSLTEEEPPQSLQTAVQSCVSFFRGTSYADQPQSPPQQQQQQSSAPQGSFKSNHLRPCIGVHWVKGNRDAVVLDSMRAPHPHSPSQYIAPSQPLFCYSSATVGDVFSSTAKKSSTVASPMLGSNSHTGSNVVPSAAGTGSTADSSSQSGSPGNSNIRGAVMVERELVIASQMAAGGQILLSPAAAMRLGSEVRYLNSLVAQQQQQQQRGNTQRQGAQRRGGSRASSESASAAAAGKDAPLSIVTGNTLSNQAPQLPRQRVERRHAFATRVPFGRHKDDEMLTEVVPEVLKDRVFQPPPFIAGIEEHESALRAAGTAGAVEVVQNEIPM